MDSIDSFLANAKYTSTSRRGLECGRCTVLLAPHETFQEHNNKCPKNIKNIRYCRVCGSEVIKTELYQHIRQCQRNKILMTFVSFSYSDLERIWRIIDVIDDFYDIKLEDAIMELCRSSRQYDYDNRKLISIMADLDTPLSGRIHKEFMTRTLGSFLFYEFSVDEFTIKKAIDNLF